MSYGNEPIKRANKGSRTPDEYKSWESFINLVKGYSDYFMKYLSVVELFDIVAQSEIKQIKYKVNKYDRIYLMKYFFEKVSERLDQYIDQEEYEKLVKEKERKVKNHRQLHWPCSNNDKEHSCSKNSSASSKYAEEEYIAFVERQENRKSANDKSNFLKEGLV